MKKYDLVKKPVDYLDGTSPDRCSMALFPGYGICNYEPDLVVSTYDVLLFQRPDTGIFIYDFAEDDAEMVGLWEELGKPTLIFPCPRLMDKFKKHYPDISVDSLYEVFLDLEIGGGRYNEKFVLHTPDDISSEFLEAVKTLIEDMEIELVDPAPGIPFITCSMADRNSLKREGQDAVHILELIFGMGASNTHLIHEDEGPDCDGNCLECDKAIDCEYEAGGQMVIFDRPKKSDPAPLPDEAQIEANRAALLSNPIF